MTASGATALQSFRNGLRNSRLALSGLPAVLAISFAILYAFGFMFQLMGLGITATNVIVLCGFSLYCLQKGRALRRIRPIGVAYTALVLSVFLFGAYSSSSPYSFVVYAYYVGTVGISFFVGTLVVRKKYFGPDAFFSFAALYICLQLFVLALQRASADLIVSLSRTSLALEDVASGTFYLASDATLAFFCTTVLIAVFASGQAGARRVLIVVATTLAVMMTSSKAAHMTHIVVLVALVAFQLAARFRKGVVLMLTVVGLISLILLILKADALLLEGAALSDRLVVAYDDRWREIGAHRLAPIGGILGGELKWLGEGFFAYYNPVDKVWAFYAGFSMFYTLYIELGLLLASCMYLFVFFSIRQFERRWSYSFLYFSVFFVFSIFNFAMTDIAVLVSLIIVVGQGSHREARRRVSTNPVSLVG